jgi:DNA-binding NarL/FixJ family response regulator
MIGMELPSQTSLTVLQLKVPPVIRVVITCHRSSWPHQEWLDSLGADGQVRSVEFPCLPYEPFDELPEVLILCTPEPVDALRQLTNAMGGSLPPVLLITPVVEPRQIVAVFRLGVIGCLISGDYTESALTGALVATSAGQLALSPLAASALTKASSPEAEESRQPEGNSVSGMLREVLSTREQQIMDLLASGYDAAEISHLLSLTEKTVRNNLSSIYAKLQTRGRTETVLLWLGRSPRHGARNAVGVS